MLGFHRRTRSLIPVKDLVKYDKVSIMEREELEEEERFGTEGAESEAADRSRSTQLMLVYLVFLAEA